MSRDSFIQRRIQSQVKAALADTPVVLVNGTRQAGKTTLVKRVAGAAAWECLSQRIRAAPFAIRE